MKTKYTKIQLLGMIAHLRSHLCEMINLHRNDTTLTEEDFTEANTVLNATSFIFNESADIWVDDSWLRVATVKAPSGD